MTMIVPSTGGEEDGLGFAWLSLIPALLPVAQKILGAEAPKPSQQDALDQLKQGNPGFFNNGGAQLTPEQVQAIVNATLQQRGVQLGPPAYSGSYPGGYPGGIPGTPGGGITSTYGVQTASMNASGTVNCPPTWYYGRRYGICYDPNVYASEEQARDAFTRGGGVIQPQTPTQTPTAPAKGGKVAVVGTKKGVTVSRKGGSAAASKKSRRKGGLRDAVDLEDLSDAMTGSRTLWPSLLFGGLALAGGIFAAVRASNPHGASYLGEG